MCGPPSSDLRVRFLKSQVNRHTSQGAKWCNTLATTYLTSSMHPTTRSSTSSVPHKCSKRRKPTCSRSQMQYSVRARVLSLSLVLHAWPHDTWPYHSSGQSSAALGRELYNKSVVDYCLASMLCDTTRFHYIGKRQQRPSRSLARAREISCDCCTACRMARKN